jgi:hypothetical protein
MESDISVVMGSCRVGHHVGGVEVWLWWRHLDWGRLGSPCLGDGRFGEERRGFGGDGDVPGGASRWWGRGVALVAALGLGTAGACLASVMGGLVKNDEASVVWTWPSKGKMARRSSGGRQRRARPS